MNNSLVRCDKCGMERELSFGYCLFNGWPRCCGYTMRLVKHPLNIETVVADGILENAEITVQPLEGTSQ